MKSNKTMIRDLRNELRYYQAMVRVNIRSYKAGVRKCKEIAELMRTLQRGEKPYSKKG